MADPSTTTDVVDSVTKAGSGAAAGGAIALFLSWLRAERQQDRNELVREKAEAARDKRHEEMVEAIRAHTQAMVSAMAEQSKAQLAGIQAASEAQARAFAEAGAQRFAELAAKLDAIAGELRETKQDMRELRRELHERAP